MARRDVLVFKSIVTNLAFSCFFFVNCTRVFVAISMGKILQPYPIKLLLRGYAAALYIHFISTNLLTSNIYICNWYGLVRR